MKLQIEEYLRKGVTKENIGNLLVINDYNVGKFRVYFKNSSVFESVKSKNIEDKSLRFGNKFIVARSKEKLNHIINEN